MLLCLSTKETIMEGRQLAASASAERERDRGDTFSAHKFSERKESFCTWDLRASSSGRSPMIHLLAREALS